jgi:hypothetical protein
VAELDQLDPPSAGKAGIQAALDKVQANLAALRGSATGQWGSQITELDGAVEALKTTIAGISGDSLVSDLPTILSDLQRIDTAGRRCSSRSTRTAASPTRRSRSCLGVDRQAGDVLRAMDSSARPCSWRTCGPRRPSAPISA